MSFLRSRGPKPAEIPQYTGLQIQTSSNAVPIPIVYGINKVAPNVTSTFNFQSTPQYTKTGGKGGGRKTLSGYQYHAQISMGLCEGPIAAVGTVWSGQSLTALWALNLNLKPGTQTQTPWDAYTGLSYKGLAYVYSYFYDLGQSASIGSVQFEVYGVKYSTAVVNAHDADPAEVLYDFLTNSQYGVGFPAGSIDGTTLFGSSGDSSYQTYCQAVGIAFSPVLANKETANSIVTRWLKLTNTGAVWSGGKLKLVPYGDTSVTGQLYAGGTVTFNPNVTPVYALTDDDFVGDSQEDPVKVERKDPYASFNVLEIEITDRLAGYNSYPVVVWDQNAIELYGRRDGPTQTAHEICDREIAQKIAQLAIQREVYIRNTYTFKLSFEYCLLEPMDIVTLSDSALGLSAAPVRIISIEEADDGLLTVTAEEFPNGVGTAVSYPVQANLGTAVDRNIVPSAVNPPVIFEPPSNLTNGARQVWIAVSGGLATAYKLAEDSSNNTHFAAESMMSKASGTAVTFAVHAMAAERSALRLQIFDGVASQSVDFDLAAGAANGATPGISAYAIVSEGPWYKLSISSVMAATAAPVVYLFLQDPLGTIAYAGTSGSGVIVWGPEFGTGGEDMSMILVPLSPAGATLAAYGVTTPEGAEGTADPYWGGCIIYISTDNSTYGQIGQVNGPARHGVLTAAIASSGSPLSVDLTRSGGTLASASIGDAQAGATLSLVGNELLAYATATLTGTNTYNLTGVIRGLEGTAPASHSIGDRFLRLDDAIFKYALPAAYVGQMLYLKFQSFNVFGQALQDLDTCAVYTYTPNGAGAGIGPVASALALGSSLDYGAASEVVTTVDDFGLASDSNVTVIDLGLASA